MVNNIVNGKLLTRQNYNLGAYDTVDTSNANYDLIMRKTGYIDCDKKDWSYNSTLSYWYISLSNTVAVYPANNQTKAHIFSNNYTTVSAQNMTTNACALYVNSTILQVNNGSSTQKPTGIIQFELVNSYTEKVIKNQPINTLDQNASQWVRNEWEKGLQLWNETTRGGYFDSLGNYKSANNQLCSCMISVKPNTTYTLSGWNSGNICFFQQNGTFIRRDSPVNTFTTPSNCYYISLSFGTDYGTTYNHDIMLNEGTHAYPYVPYYGSIARQDQVLLWENSSPTSTFSAQNVSFNTSASNFKYIVFAFKITQATTQGIQTLKCFVPSSLNSNVSFFLGCFDDTSSMTYRRLFTMTSYTGGSFSSGYNKSDSSTNADVCVPVAIYGTNVL